MADPAEPLPAGQPVWRPDVSPFTLRIGHPPSGCSDFPGIDPDALPGVSARISGEDGLHIRIGEGLRVAHLWFDPACHVWGSVLLPSCPDRIRLGMAGWLGDWLKGRTRKASPEGLWLTPFRQSHLSQILRAWDGDQAGVSQQDLAARLLHPDVRKLSAAGFADSAERKQIRRWLDRARWLIDGGYHHLLQGEWRFA